MATGRSAGRKEYDFSKARRNPHARRLKRQVTIRLDQQTIEYFGKLAAETGIPYQTLINLYLRDCAASGKKPSLKWSAEGASGYGGRSAAAGIPSALQPRAR